MNLIRRLLKWRVLRWLGAAVLVPGLLYLLLPRPELYPPEFRFSRTLEDRHGKLLHLTLTPDGKYRRHTALAEISPSLIEAALELEDRHFYDHPGVNPLSLLRAAWGVISGSARGGGSALPGTRTRRPRAVRRARFPSSPPVPNRAMYRCASPPTARSRRCSRWSCAHR